MNTQDQKNTKPETSSTNQRAETFQPTSAAQDQMPQQDDAQQPTHDALSDIYNRGYSV
jgi:hypothetical protein